MKGVGCTLVGYLISVCSELTNGSKNLIRWLKRDKKDIRKGIRIRGKGLNYQIAQRVLDSARLLKNIEIHTVTYKLPQ